VGDLAGFERGATWTLVTDLVAATQQLIAAHPGQLLRRAGSDEPFSKDPIAPDDPLFSIDQGEARISVVDDRRELLTLTFEHPQLGIECPEPSPVLVLELGSGGWAARKMCL
jgi:hypothetical protein